jgi:ATP-dependent DNA helicase RecG
MKSDLKPTLAGILLFGTNRALRQFYPMMRIDYIRVPGIEWVRDPDRRYETIEIRSPLLRAVQRARAAILDDLPKAFSLPAGETQGRDFPLLPDRVIREVVANAAIHRSYTCHGSIQVIRYANRLEIRNPGYSLKAYERLGEPGSETRNPKIAAVFHDLRLAETKGSGIRVMRQLMSEGSLSPPYFQSDRTNNSFNVILLFHHFLSTEDIEWIKAFRHFVLSDSEAKALVSAREVGAIDNAAYRNLNQGIDTLSASRQLRKLCDCRLLEKRGRGSTTYYIPTSKVIDEWKKIQARKLGESNTSKELDKKPHLEIDRWSASKEDWMRLLPTALWLDVQRLGSRASKDLLSRLVYKLCSWHDLPLPAISKIISRKESYVLKQFIIPLLQQGRLSLTIEEDKETGSRQTYRAVQTGKSGDLHMP